jgi:hypothetical protein
MHHGREIGRRVVLGGVGLDVRADPEDEVVLGLVRLEEAARLLEVCLDRGCTLDPHRSPPAGRRGVSVRGLMAVGGLALAVDR